MKVNKLPPIFILIVDIFVCVIDGSAPERLPLARHSTKVNMFLKGEVVLTVHLDRHIFYFFYEEEVWGYVYILFPSALTYLHFLVITFVIKF